ncbi:MAG TPA: phosphatase PAP2 family protein [Phenylobacterium sp.]
MANSAADTESEKLGSIEQADVALGRRLAEGRDRPLVRAVARVGKLSDQEPLYGLAAAVACAGLLTRRPRLAQAGLRMGLAVGAADLAKSALKRQVRRTRPHVLMDEARYERAAEPSSEKPEQSFPSGHMAGAVAAAAALGRCYPASLRYSLPLCAVAGWSRIAKAAHWPLDVAAGAVIGLCAERTTAALFRRADDPAKRRTSGA